jgi:hypothetical protein
MVLFAQELSELMGVGRKAGGVLVSVGVREGVGVCDCVCDGDCVCVCDGVRLGVGVGESTGPHWRTRTAWPFPPFPPPDPPTATPSGLSDTSVAGSARAPGRQRTFETAGVVKEEPPPAPT